MAKPAFIAMAALALLATPVLARNSKAQKADSEDGSPSCSSYQLGPDGNWEQLPCQEVGTRSSSEHRAPSKSHGEHEQAR
jgi:hypothetical protein